MDKYTQVKAAQGKCTWLGGVQRRQSIPRYSIQPILQSLAEGQPPPGSSPGLLQASIFWNANAYFIRYSLNGVSVSQLYSLLFEGRDKHFVNWIQFSGPQTSTEFSLSSVP